MTTLRARNITKRFKGTTALDKVSFEIRDGEFVCILGPSGCGKSTLLRALAGLEAIDGGTIEIGGRDVTCEPPSERNFGIVFQSYALFPNLNVEENIAYGLCNKGLAKDEIAARVAGIIEMTGLGGHNKKYPQQLSGGQQQRAAICRALVLNPEFLLLDEPLSALDAKVRLRLRREIRRIQQRFAITTIMVTHDQEEALSMADRIIVMNEGRIEQMDTPQALYDAPVNGFVADFVGTANFVGAGRAIRPESLCLSKSLSDSAVQAEVCDVEYRGAFYRLEVDTHVGHLMIDIPSQQSDARVLRLGSRLYIDIPQDKVIMLKSA